MPVILTRVRRPPVSPASASPPSRAQGARRRTHRPRRTVRITNTYPVSGSLAFKSYKLADVTTPQIIQKRPTRVPSWSRLELLVLDLLRRGQGSRRQATS